MSVTRIYTSFTPTRASSCHVTAQKGQRLFTKGRWSCCRVRWARGGLVSVDMMICEPVRAGLADRMRLRRLISSFLAVCLLAHQGVSDLFPQRQHLPVTQIPAVLHCDNVIGHHVWPSYAQSTCWCVYGGKLLGFETPCVARGRVFPRVCSLKLSAYFVNLCSLIFRFVTLCGSRLRRRQ